jgi:hypothetical protein
LLIWLTLASMVMAPGSNGAAKLNNGGGLTTSATGGRGAGEAVDDSGNV